MTWNNDMFLLWLGEEELKEALKIDYKICSGLEERKSFINYDGVFLLWLEVKALRD
jgi:hypothetical protein